jgi:hypothetical protein
LGINNQWIAEAVRDMITRALTTADKNLVDWYLIKIKNKFGEDVVWQDAKQWVEENCKGEYVAYYVLFFFKEKSDAAKFKLFWG